MVRGKARQFAPQQASGTNYDFEVMLGKRFKSSEAGPNCAEARAAGGGAREQPHGGMDAPELKIIDMCKLRKKSASASNG